MRQLPCLLLILCLLISHSFGAEPLVIDPATDFKDTSAEAVPVPGQKDALGIRLKADTPQYGWCIIPLGRTLPRGTYSAQFTLSAAEAGAAGAALYAVSSDDKHYPFTNSLTAPAGAVVAGNGIGFVPSEFSALAWKKTDASATPSAAISQITITDLGQAEYPRLSAYHALMQYPAPWGLYSPALAKRIAQARAKDANVGQMEEAANQADVWLDLRSAAADACCRADYLFRVTRLLKTPEVDALQAKAEQVVTNLKQAIQQDRLAEVPSLLDESEKTLTALETALSEKLHGVVMPEHGTDIFTWLKAWRFSHMPSLPEWAEPTPYCADYGGLKLTLAKPDGNMTLTSTWTTNTYGSPSMTVRYSVLTPLSTVDVQDGRFSMSVEGLVKPQVLLSTSSGNPQSTSLSKGPIPGVDDKMPKGWFALVGEKQTLLFVLNRKPTSAQWTGRQLTMTFAGPAAVGYVVCGNGIKSEGLAKLGAFYQRLLCNQPVECVQVQRGREIEQTFEYVRRESDWPVRAVTLAPLPQLASLSRKHTSALHVAVSQNVQTSPDGWEFVNDSEFLQYIIPNRKDYHTWGVNLIPCNATRDLYVQIAGEGCRTVRLVCGGFRPWDPKNLESLKELTQQNLQWAREAGLKVGVDMHCGWIPEQKFSNPDMLVEFISRWKTILSWCKDYQDIVIWYDLMNEPLIFVDREDVRPYAKFMRQVVKELRPFAGDTPILVEGVGMANPVGLEWWEDLGDNNIIVGFHDYYPHTFTHQGAVDRGNPAMPHVFFPSFMPMISWTSPEWRNDQAFVYWDRWKCDANCLPAFRLMIEKNARLDSGEYGVIGYAGDASKRSGVLWLRQAMERYRRMGISHNAWSVSGGTGYTFLIPEFKAEVLRLWQKWAGEEGK